MKNLMISIANRKNMIEKVNGDSLFAKCRIIGFNVFSQALLFAFLGTNKFWHLSKNLKPVLLNESSSEVF